jgi:UDP-3-O-[3-hydroxymyristoyl] glucosamine N-acyltransferase
MKFIETTLGKLVDLFGGELVSFNASEKPDKSLMLSGIQSLEHGQSCHLGFFTNPKLKEQLRNSAVGVVMVRANQFDELAQFLAAVPSPKSAKIAWLVPDPYLYYARIQQWWVQQSAPAAVPGVHPTAVVMNGAQIDPSASVGPLCVVGENTVVGPHAVLHASVVLGREVQVGEASLIHPNVSVYDECQIGAHCIIHSGVVIGADGFGFANEKGAWVKIPQVGKVVLADQVEVGANTTIDRGALEDTLIGFGVKLDNQIQIAHNVVVGEHTAMAGCVGVAGSTVIGARCTVGGAAMVFGHLTIPDGTHVSGASVVMSSIKEPGAYTGIFPLQEHKDWEKTAVSLRQIVKLRTEVRDIKNNKL